MTTDRRADWASLVPDAEIRTFLATAREHFARLYPVTALLELADEPHPGDTWAELVEQGYTSVGLPEEHDGIGSFADLTAVLEESGRALVPAPLTLSVAAAHTLLAAGLAHDSLATTRSTLLVDRGRGARTALDADQVEEAVLIIPGASGVAVVRAAFDTAELPGAPVDAAHRARRIIPTATIARADLPERDLDDLLVAARLGVAAELVGLAAGALDGALGHVRTRRQFDRPIGAFQAVKHMLADVHVAIEGARSLVRGASAGVGTGAVDEQTVRLSLLAAAASSEAALRATAVRTQLLGAMGLTFESDNHLGLRRTHDLARVFGSPADLYARAGARTLEAAR